MGIIGTGDYQEGERNNLEEIVEYGGRNYTLPVVKLSPDSSVIPFAYAESVVASGTSGINYISKFGYNGAVGTSEEPVWAESSVAYTYAATGTLMTASSSNVNDTALGSGARTLYVEGLLYGGQLAYETVTLNGQTGVQLSNLYWRVYRAFVVSAGNGGTNAGNIYVGYGTITTGKPATVQSSIVAGMAQSLQAMCPVPANKTGPISGEITASFDKAGELRVYIRPQNGVFRISRRFPTVAGVNRLPLYFPIKVSSQSDIEILALVGTGTGVVGASFDLELI